MVQGEYKNGMESTDNTVRGFFNWSEFLGFFVAFLEMMGLFHHENTWRDLVGTQELVPHVAFSVMYVGVSLSVWL